MTQNTPSISTFVSATQRHLLRPLLAILCIFLGPIAAGAGTTVERGDVLRVEVMNAPEFSREVAVDIDGRIALHILGRIPVAGRDTDTIAASIAAAFKQEALLTAPEVLVEVASYRPVYVGGSVARPGAIDFVPGMTARHAIIAAGGIRLMAAESAPASQDVLAAVAERQSKAFSLAQVVARIARLEADLADESALPDVAAEDPVPSSVQAETLASESALHADELARRDARKGHAESMIELINLEIATLSQQADLQSTESAIQQSEVDAARDLVSRGLMPQTRLQELLREQSRLSRDRLETSAFEARARQQAETERFELANEVALRREQTRLELQDARARRAALDADIAALDLRILSAGLAQPETTHTRLVIYRRDGDAQTEIEADMNAPLQPGDVLEVALVLSATEGVSAVASAPVREARP